MANLSKEQLPILSPWGKAVAGAAAAMIANALVYPLDLAKTRLQVQTKSTDPNHETYTSSWDVIQKVYAKKGIKGVYAGLSGTLLGTASTNFAYFYWYSLVRDAYIRRSPGKSLTTATELLLGAVAGALAQLFTIPVSVITARQQTSDNDSGFFATAKDVIGQDGISGLWRGLKVSLVLVINPSITYGTSSRVRSLLFKDKISLSVGENFILGAVSKAAATIATQPMIVAKIMQQTSKKAKASQESDEKGESVPVFDSFVDAIVYLYKTEGLLGMFKGLGPQISKGIIVQGLLLAFKDKAELYMVLLMRLIQKRSAIQLAVV
ncbi:Peroxisomal adenine nucleotide transporter 1 [Wickerhamiella sorbophila]|uniref:Peroxisomal adenine nucleotide transporter 1 n=1 Tax=Wickerhamiella sorbophila TaxID=45607 RepID=A0A2T0FBT0_9ASCO|nr:Peroxisomal adenine nucleotide transporter 1 [Wickerhamiella sorbophila]PRT52420.1 Peroxisomal adenine nucleotide transporter 1 [Wickerhamiella sorbophila]